MCRRVTFGPVKPCKLVPHIPEFPVSWGLRVPERARHPGTRARVPQAPCMGQTMQGVHACWRMAPCNKPHAPSRSKVLPDAGKESLAQLCANIPRVVHQIKTRAADSKCTAFAGELYPRGWRRWRSCCAINSVPKPPYIHTKHV